jgi:hypothetical protein
VPSPGNPQSLNRYSYVLGNPLKYVDPSGHDWNNIVDFWAGAGYQWAYSTLEGHSLGLMSPESRKWMDSLAVDSDSFREGRILGGGIVFVQGVVEGVAGGLTFLGGVGGGAATCLETLGGGCVAGATVAGVGAYAAVAGVASAGSGLNAAGQQASILYAKVKNGGPDFSFQKLGGGTGQDAAGKGYHINSKYGELTINANRTGNGFDWQVTTSGGDPVDPKVAQGAIKFLMDNKAKAMETARGIISNWGWSTDPTWIKRVEEARRILDALQQ